MKKFKLLMLAFVIGTASLFAMETESPESLEKEMRNEIVKLLQSPDFVIDEEINVVLKFTFNSEGEIVVLCPGCKNREIVDYIREHLNRRKFENPGIKDKIYKLPLKIEVV